MSFLARVLFESPAWLGLFAFPAFAGVLLGRARMASAVARRWSLPGLLLLIVLLLLIQTVVVTERETLLRRLEALVLALEREDLPAIEGMIAGATDSQGMDAERFAARVESFLRRWDIRDTRIRRRVVRVEGRAAEMRVVARVTASDRGGIGMPHRGTWRLRWVQESGVWKVAAVQPVTLDGRSIGTLDAPPH